MKLARQYFLEKPKPENKRTKFIARHQSYHGTTLGSLAMGGHAYRRAKFEPMLLTNISRVSPCFPYRNQSHGESDKAYVARLAQELDAEFQRLGPETVCAFVAEPVVGAVSRLNIRPFSFLLFSSFFSLTYKLGARMCHFCTWLLQSHEAGLR